MVLLASSASVISPTKEIFVAVVKREGFSGVASMYRAYSVSATRPVKLTDIVLVVLYKKIWKFDEVLFRLVSMNFIYWGVGVPPF